VITATKRFLFGAGIGRQQEKGRVKILWRLLFLT